MNTVFTSVLTSDNANAASTARSVPNTTRVVTFTTRPFCRSLWTVAYLSFLGSTGTGLLRRPRRPVRGASRTSAYAAKIAFGYAGYSSDVIRFMSRPPVRFLKSSTNSCVCVSVRLPGTTLTTRRCSGSKATWSQWSPSSPAEGSSGRQCFSFLATNDHFSSNCTSRVSGGKSHALVVDVLGLLARDQGQPHHRVFVDSDEAAGLTHAATFLQMLEDRERFLLGEFAVIQGGAFALGEAFLTGAAGEHTAFLVGAITEAHADVIQAAAAVVGALRILAAEDFQVVHRGSSRSKARGKVAKQLELAYKAAGTSARLIGHDPAS